MFWPFWGAKKIFFAKVPQYWSSFLKKYIVFFVILGGGRGSNPIWHLSYFFLFFLKASLILIQICIIEKKKTSWNHFCNWWNWWSLPHIGRHKEWGGSEMGSCKQWDSRDIRRARRGNKHWPWWTICNQVVPDYHVISHLHQFLLYEMMCSTYFFVLGLVVIQMDGHWK